jgi:hypothetical protein
VSGNIATIGNSSHGIGSCRVGKRRINAKKAVADIRAGMEDAALMNKYNLKPAGLQSLFDKLIVGGFIDLAEMERRLTGFLGTVAISESDLAPQDGNGLKSITLPDRKSPPRIHAQQAARDIRLGVSDFALMEKYGLSSKGLQSLFDKLVSAGLITKEDVDNRGIGIDDTVDLTEEMLSLSGALRCLGASQPAPPLDAVKQRLREVKPAKRPKPVIKAKPKPASRTNESEKIEEIEEVPEPTRSRWYDRISTFSKTGKVLTAVVLAVLAIACLTLILFELTHAG